MNRIQSLRCKYYWCLIRKLVSSFIPALDFRRTLRRFFMLYAWYRFASAIFKQTLEHFTEMSESLQMLLKKYPWVFLAFMLPGRCMYILLFILHHLVVLLQVMYAKTACMDDVCRISLLWQETNRC